MLKSVEPETTSSKVVRWRSTKNVTTFLLQWDMNVM